MLISLVCILLIGILSFVYIFGGGKNNKYGERLENIETVKIAESKFKEIENKLKEEKNMEKISLRLQGRIIYATIYLEKDGSVNDGKNVSTKVIEQFNEEEKTYYDFQFIVTKKELSEEDVFPIMGYRNSSTTSITWTNNAS